MDSFCAARDCGSWLCSALHAGVVELPFHAGQCGLEGAIHAVIDFYHFYFVQFDSQDYANMCVDYR